MAFNEKFNPLRFSNGLQSHPEHQMPERTVTCGNSKKIDRPRCDYYNGDRKENFEMTGGYAYEMGDFGNWEYCGKVC